VNLRSASHSCTDLQLRRNGGFTLPEKQSSSSANREGATEVPPHIRLCVPMFGSLLESSKIIIVERKAICCLRRKSPKEYNGNSRWTAGVNFLSLAFSQALPVTGYLDVVRTRSPNLFKFR
jgi:hypothetical protein